MIDLVGYDTRRFGSFSKYCSEFIRARHGNLILKCMEICTLPVLLREHKDNLCNECSSTLLSSLNACCGHLVS